MQSDENSQADLSALDAQITELKGQLQQMTDIAARAQADLQNAKVRMQKDSDDLRKFAAESTLKKFLPVIDGFQRAFQHLPADLAKNDWVKGVQAVEQELLRQAAEMGLAKMECMGQQVDTARHDVLTVGPGEEGIILEVLEDGYELNGKVLRPAKVKVGSGASA